MRIVELRVEGFKRIKAIRIRPDGDIVQVAGRNEQGKTSALDSIWAGMKGRAVAGPNPVNKGMDEAKIMIDLGEVTVHRSFKRAKDGEVTTGLKVFMGGAEVRKSPQAVLDGMIGALSLDPLAFCRDKPAAQLETLKGLVKGFDFAANAAQRKELYDERTDVNREATNSRAAAATISLPPGPKPKAVDVAAKIDEMQRAALSNADLARKRTLRAGSLAEVENMRSEAERLRARATTLENTATQLEASMPPPIADDQDVSVLRAEIAAAESVKQVIAKHEERERHELAATAKQAESASLTERIEELDRLRAAAIAQAKLPVEGLGLGDDCVMLNGLPLANASDAEQLRTSVAIAMALNPDLRVIRVHEGSVLDSRSLGIIAAMAKIRDYQCWVERVDETGQVGFLIEDGQLAAVNGERVKP